jgi:hypothetical protein
MSPGSARRFAALLVVPIALILASCGLFHKNSTTAGLGQEVVDGKFAFVVNQVETSPTFADTHAQGVYLIVSMAVRNVGNHVHFFESGAQKLKDSTDRKYSACLMDPAKVGDDDDVNGIDPGLQVSVKLAFDVPPGTKPIQIMLHDSTTSPGVPVNLKQPRPPHRGLKSPTRPLPTSPDLGLSNSAAVPTLPVA